MNKGSSLTPDDHAEFWIRAYLGRDGDWLDRCIRAAYSDMARRTLTGINDIPNSDTLREKSPVVLKQRLVLLRDSLLTPDTATFDTWHRTTCLALIDVYRELGYCDKDGCSLFYVGHAQKWVNMALKYTFQLGNRLPDYGNVYDLCHMPIDNIVLGAFDAQKCPGFHFPKYSWSRLKDYTEDYMCLQEWVRRTFTIPPLDVEFRAWLGEDLSAFLAAR